MAPPGRSLWIDRANFEAAGDGDGLDEGCGGRQFGCMHTFANYPIKVGGTEPYKLTTLSLKGGDIELGPSEHDASKKSFRRVTGSEAMAQTVEAAIKNAGAKTPADANVALVAALKTDERLTAHVDEVVSFQADASEAEVVVTAVGDNPFKHRFKYV